LFVFFFFSSRRRHTRSTRDWSSDVCSSDLLRSLLSSACRERSSRFGLLFGGGPAPGGGPVGVRWAKLELARQSEKIPATTSHDGDRKSTRLNSSHEWISYAVFCLKKKKCKE